MAGFENGALYKSDDLSRQREGLGPKALSIFDEKEYHSIASKVYEIRELLNIDPNYKLTEAEQRLLIDLKHKIPAMRSREAARIRDAAASLRVSGLPKRDIALETERLLKETIRYKHIQDALRRHIDHIIRDNKERVSQSVEKTESAKLETERTEQKSSEEKFSPEEYRKNLETKIPSFGKLVKLTRVFGRTDVILGDDYKKRSPKDIEADLVSLRDARVELENEMINVAGEEKKEAQIRDFVLPGLKILESKIEDARAERTRSLNKYEIDAWEIDMRGAVEYRELFVIRGKVELAITKAASLNEGIRLYKLLREAQDKLNLLKKSRLVRLPESLQGEGEKFFETQATQTTLVLEKVGERVFDLWKTELETKPEFIALEKALVSARSPGGSVSDIELQEKEINDAIVAILPNAQWTSLLPDIPDVQTRAEGHVQSIIDLVDKKTKDPDGKERSIRDRLREAKNERITAATDVEKRRLQGIVDQIEQLDYKDDEDFAKRAKLSDLEKMKRDLYAVRDELRKKNISFIDVDPRYDKQEQRLHQFIERATVLEMSFADIVKRVKAARYDVYKASNLIGNITDPVERALIKRFQAFYYSSSETYSGGDKDKELEHRRLKVEIWAERYNDEHYGGQYVPAAAVTDSAGEDILYSSLKNRKLFRDDILAVIDNPRYAKSSREMLSHGIQVIAGEINPPGLKLSYGDLANTADGPKYFKDYLRVEFVNSGKLSEDQFEILWNLFVDFDLASVGLARTQKDTQTRSHNPGKKIDTEFLSYPLHVMSHMRNRYGNIDTAAQHLLIFTGEYPSEFVVTSRGRKYLWSGNEEIVDSTRVRTEEETRQLILAYMEAHMPLGGIKESVLTSGTDAEWNRPIFPDPYDFLTAEFDSTKTKGSFDATIGNTDLYLIGMEGWNRMLEMTIKSLSSGSLKLHDIFKDGGIYKQFVNEGIGKAKVVKGEHYKWFVPMLRYFVGRLSVAFDDDGLVVRRKELKEQLIEQLKTGTGLKIDEIKTDLDAFIKELEAGKNRQGPAWKGIPEILMPYDDHRRRNERIAYMRLWWRDKKKGKIPPPPVSGGLLPSPRAGVRGTFAVDPDVQAYYDAIEERIPLPQIIDRSSFNKDTSEKK